MSYFFEKLQDVLFVILRIKPHTRQTNYTHWDLLALARKIDPEAWLSFDVQKRNNPALEYFQYKPVFASFNSAVAVLKSFEERILPWKPLYGKEALQAFIQSQNFFLVELRLRSQS